MPSYLSERVRLLFKMNSVANTRDDLTEQEVDLWRQTDWRFEVGFAFGDELVDVSVYESAKIEIMPADDKTGAALAEKSITADDFTAGITLEEWQSGAGQHAVFKLGHAETAFDLGGDDDKTFYLVCSLRTTTGEWIVAGYATVRVYEPGTPKEDVFPVQGGNIVPLGASYNGSGNYVLSVTLDKAYNIAFGANETTVTNGNQTLNGSGTFSAQDDEITLHGTPDELVTAVIRGTIYLTADESDARYFTDRQRISQTGHGLAAKDVVRFNGTAYVKARADAEDTAEAIGIVESATEDEFVIVRAGGLLRNVTGLTPGVVYFLSDATAGLLTATEPTASGVVTKPMLFALTSTSGVVLNYRGIVVEDSDIGGEVFGETPAGAINGVNDVFETAFNYYTGTLRVFRNGLRLPPSAYTESGPDEFTMNQPPGVNDTLLVDYIKE